MGEERSQSPICIQETRDVRLYVVQLKGDFSTGSQTIRKGERRGGGVSIDSHTGNKGAVIAASLNAS